MINQSDIQIINNNWSTLGQSALEKFISIPNTTPCVYTDPLNDADQMLAVINHAVNFLQLLQIPNLTTQILQNPARTPLLLVKIEGTLINDDEYLFYMHLDKQPPLTDAWSEGLGPYTPVIKDNKLYGRGSSDDGYAIFALGVILRSLIDTGKSYCSMTIIAECSEESGSCDLQTYLESYQYLLGNPTQIFILDSGANDSDTKNLYITSSLRGCVMGYLNVKVLTQSVHSGAGGGIIPNPFNVLVNQLNRFNESKCISSNPPDQIKDLMFATSEYFGDNYRYQFPIIDNLTLDNCGTNFECYCKNVWDSTCEIVGIDMFPTAQEAGNIISPEIRVKFSMRLPPNLDNLEAEKIIKDQLEMPDQWRSQFVVSDLHSCSGWVNSISSPIFDEKILKAIEGIYDSIVYVNVGASIPTNSLISKMFPDANIITTGVITKDSNIHSHDENLDLDLVKRFMTFLYRVIYL